MHIYKGGCTISGESPCCSNLLHTSEQWFSTWSMWCERLPYLSRVEKDFITGPGCEVSKTTAWAICQVLWFLEVSIVKDAL